MAVFSFIEGWHNPGRRHPALGESLIEYERISEVEAQTVTLITALGSEGIPIANFALPNDNPPRVATRGQFRH